jgi:hypothetical protein
MLGFQRLTGHKTANQSSLRQLHRAKRPKSKRYLPRIEFLEDLTLPAPFPPADFLTMPFPSHASALAEHFHPHLKIFIDGVEHAIKGDTNIVRDGDPITAQGVPVGLYPIHVHKEDLDTNPPDTGKLHVESTQLFDFHLGDFFTIWTFTSGSPKVFNQNELRMLDNNGQDIDFKADATHTITMTVDGQPSTDFENFVLTDPHSGGGNPGPTIVITCTTITPPPPPPPPPTGTSNQIFVTNCYTDFLGRRPDPAGMNQFSSMLDQGVNRAQIILTIESSLEARTKLTQDMYQKYLGRRADPVGLSLCTQWLANGGSLAQVRETIVASPEVFGHQGNDNGRFVTTLYRDALSRAVDPVGQQAVAALNQGFNRRQLTDRVFGSPEGQQAVVQSYYNLLLHRRADDGGLTFNTARIRNGVPEQQIAAGIAASDEFFNRR